VTLREFVMCPRKSSARKIIELNPKRVEIFGDILSVK